MYLMCLMYLMWLIRLVWGEVEFVSLGVDGAGLGKIRYLCGSMAKKEQKTNAARLLDAAGIAYELIPYDFDPEDLAAEHVASSLGEDIRCVFKTLVLEGDKSAGHFVCVVPGNAEVDLKKAAKVAGAKKADLIPMKQLQPLTGYIRGGCTAIGMKKQFPTYFHESAMAHEYIYVSAGQRGLQLKINPAELIAYVGAQVADIIK